MSPTRSLSFILTTVVALGALGLSASSIGQDKPERPAEGQAKKKQEIPDTIVISYALRFASAKTVHVVLADLLADKSVKLAIDERSNRLIVLADKKTHDVIQELLKNLDSAGDLPQTTVIPAKNKASIMRDLIKQLDLKITVAVDPALETLIIRGKKEDVEHAQQLIKELEGLFEHVKPAAPLDQQYSIELFTFAAGEGQGGEIAFHQQGLDEVIKALHQKGIAKPAIHAQTQILTLSNTEFLAEDGMHNVSGRILPTAKGVRVELQVELRPNEQAPPRVFQTTIAMKVDHPVIFAATKTDPKSDLQVFAIRIRESD